MIPICSDGQTAALKAPLRFSERQSVLRVSKRLKKRLKACFEFSEKAALSRSPPSHIEVTQSARSKRFNLSRFEAAPYRLMQDLYPAGFFGRLGPDFESGQIWKSAIRCTPTENLKKDISKAPLWSALSASAPKARARRYEACFGFCSGVTLKARFGFPERLPITGHGPLKTAIIAS